MKKFIKYTSVAFTMLFAITSCAESTAMSDSKTELVTELALAPLYIEGMICEMGCARAIEVELKNVDGVVNAIVDYKSSVASIEYNTATTSQASLVSFINSYKDGIYSAEPLKVDCNNDCKKSCCASKKSKCSSEKTETSCTDKSKAKCASKKTSKCCSSKDNAKCSSEKKASCSDKSDAKCASEKTSKCCSNKDNSKCASEKNASSCSDKQNKAKCASEKSSSAKKTSKCCSGTAKAKTTI